MAELKIEKFDVKDSVVDIAVSFVTEQKIDYTPRLSIVFTCSQADRRLPMSVKVDGNKISAVASYDAAYIFYKVKPDKIKISFVLSDGRDIGTTYDTDLVIENVKRSPIRHFLSMNLKEKQKLFVSLVLNIMSLPFRLLKIRKNRITFLTNRTKTPTGNLRAVYDVVREMEGVDVRLLCSRGGVRGNIPVLLDFMRLYMTSKIVFVDDYYHLISLVSKRRGTRLVQLWHGCGAFKAFGFSRYHKLSQLQLDSANHRQYDYALVSSPKICDFYAEAFGISRKNVVALGSPRCDILTNQSNKKRAVDEFYSKYPHLKDKKLLLFAPTFRGAGNGSCYYPTEKFNVDRVLDVLGEDWAVIVKMHPYLTEKITCSEKNSNRMVDCSASDVNDIMYVSDFLVTDYSSVIFEASILCLPMAFLAFDLNDYIEKRDFYFDFKGFVPGPIVSTDIEAAEIARAGGYDLEKIEKFRDDNFGDTAGNALKNTEELIRKILSEQ